MRHRITWLFLWITLAFWAGCTANKTQQNYTVIHEPHPIFADNTQIPQAKADPVEDKPSLKGTSRDHWSKLVVKPVSGHVKHQPTYFTGSDWRMLDGNKLAPANWHKGGLKKPTHFRFREPRPAALTPPHVQADDNTMEQRVVRVLSNNQFKTDRRDTAELIVMPIKMMYDVGVWPIRMLIEPPTSEQISPSD